MTFLLYAEAEVASNADTTDNVLERFAFDANSLIEKERLDVEKAVTDIIETQVCSIFLIVSVCCSTNKLLAKT